MLFCSHLKIPLDVLFFPVKNQKQFGLLNFCSILIFRACSPTQHRPQVPSLLPKFVWLVG